VQRRVLPPANSSLDVVLRSGTGSGKTLAFLLPALSSACPPLFVS
jgi:superfamily II DNA/RNA helicase